MDDFDVINLIEVICERNSHTWKWYIISKYSSKSMHKVKVYSFQAHSPCGYFLIYVL